MLEERPTTRDLVEAVREFLETRIIETVDKHTAFHARVAANVLKIVERELENGQTLEMAEKERLEQLLGPADSLQEQIKVLCEKIRSDEVDLQDEQLVEHLRKTTLGRLSIDNPKYSTYQLLVDTLDAR